MTKTEENDQDKNGHLLLNTLITLLIILIWVGIISALLKYDLFGIGTKVYPVLKDIPVVNKVLPEVSDKEIAEKYNYPYDNLEDAIARIYELEDQLAQATDASDSDAKTIKSLQSEVDRLKVFEENQTEFEQRVKDFDENVVFGDQAPDISEYQQYYEQINPDNAEEIYEKVIKRIQVSKALQEKADMFAKMKPKNAATILQEMTADSDSVARILATMRDTQSSQILAAMDSTYAAKITKKMLDIDAENFAE